jgi:hypothetical protein
LFVVHGKKNNTALKAQMLIMVVEASRNFKLSDCIAAIALMNCEALRHSSYGPKLLSP